MRGRDHQRGHLGGYVDPEAMVPADHPLRQIRPLVNTALARLSPEFDQLYSLTGRPSIPPEQLLRALLLQAFFTLRSERQLMEQLSYNILVRWFVGLSIEAPVWDVRVFTKNRDRLLEGDIAHGFLRAILADPQVTRLLSNEHFSVDGTLIEAWASMKSFRPKDGSYAIDARTTRDWGYQVSLLVRKRIEEVFGWMKTIGGQRKTRYRGTPRVGWMFTLSAAAYDLIRLPKLLGGAA